MTAFAAIVARQARAQPLAFGEIERALSNVYGTPCDSAVLDGCVLLAAPIAPGGNEHLVLDRPNAIGATGQVLFEDRGNLSRALNLPPHTGALRLAAAAYARWADRCTDRLAGEFALAMWNDRNGTLVCARDGLGVRSLFIAVSDDVIVVSNMLTAARAHSRVPQDVDDHALAAFLATGAVPESRTAFRAITPIPPGHTVTVGLDGQSTMRRHWSFPTSEARPIRDPRMVVEGYRAVVHAAVTERVAPRTSILLSAGVDSTTIAAAAATVTPAVALHAFTADYRRVPAASELPRARTAAAALGIPITPVAGDAYPALAHLARGSTPQPVDEPALSDWRALLGAAAAHSTIALYGEDGDSLFLPPAWRPLRRAMRMTNVAMATARYLLAAHRMPYLGLRVRERLGLVAPPAPSPPPRWLSADALQLTRAGDETTVLGHRPIALAPHPTRPEAQNRLSPGIAGYLAGILTPELTTCRLELRCPLLDTRVIQFVMNVAPIPYCQRKHLPRAAYAAILPAAIVREPKRGVGGLDAALARDWQLHDGGAVPGLLPAPLDRWVAGDEWRRALRSPDARRVTEAWRVLELADWLTTMVPDRTVREARV